MVTRAKGRSDEEHREIVRAAKARQRKNNKEKKRQAEQYNKEKKRQAENYQKRKAKKEMEKLLQSPSPGSPIGSPKGLSFRLHPGTTPRGLPLAPTPSRAPPGTPLADMTLDQLKTAKYDNEVHMMETSKVDTDHLLRNAVFRHQRHSELNNLIKNEMESRQAGRKLDFDRDYIPQVYSSVRSPVIDDDFYDCAQDMEEDRKMPARDTSTEKPAAKKRRTVAKKKPPPPRSPATKGRVRAPLKEMDENPSPPKKLTKKEKLAKAKAAGVAYGERDKELQRQQREREKRAEQTTAAAANPPVVAKRRSARNKR